MSSSRHSRYHWPRNYVVIAKLWKYFHQPHNLFELQFIMMVIRPFNTLQIQIQVDLISSLERQNIKTLKELTTYQSSNTSIKIQILILYECPVLIKIDILKSFHLSLLKVAVSNLYCS